MEGGIDMKLALFSVSYAGFWGQAYLNLEDFIVKSGELGYDGVEIMGKRPHAFPEDMTKERIEKINNLLRANGLKLACMSAYTNFTAGYESREVPFLDLQVSYIDKLAHVTKELGGNLIRVFTGYEVNGISITDQWSQCVKGLRASCDVASEYGVTVGVQNHHDIGVHTDALMELISDVNKKNIKPMFDAWSPTLRGENIKGTALEMAPKTVYTTVADYIRLPRYKYNPELVNYKNLEEDLIKAVPMGQGFIDYKGFFDNLKHGGYDGWVSYEMCSPLRGGGQMGNLDFCAKEFLKYMHNYK